MNKAKVISFLVGAFLGLGGAGSMILSAQQIKRPFTVADGIGLTYFGGPEGLGVRETASGGAVRFSPNGNYFAVHTERARPDLNRVVASLRFYRRQDVANFLKHSDALQPPFPVWVITVSEKEGPVIGEWRWLPDSSGVAVLLRTSNRNWRLALADLRKQRLEPLTPVAERVEKFDIRDRQHYVYTAVNPADLQKYLKAEHRAPAIVGTGRSLDQLLFPDKTDYKSRPTLWAVVDSKRFEVKHDSAPLVPEETMGGVYLALSPDGGSVVTTLQIPKVPKSWETLYPPPYGTSPYRVRAGQPASQYVRIDLQKGLVQALTDAPTSNASGWFTYISPSWSNDGKAILLPGTFLMSTAPSRPCIAVLYLSSNTRSCVEMLQGPTEVGWEKGSHTVQNAAFVGDKQSVMLLVSNRDDSSYSTTEYRCMADGMWKTAERLEGVPAADHGGIEVAVKQTFNEPPQLVATNKQTSRVIWDPNPELKSIELGQARVETWKDKDGRDWRGGLYLPNNYKAGHRYPLVIQTHGFNESEFLPSGVYPTAFAARALATMGIAVLQVRESCAIAMPIEGPCAVSGYEAAVNNLVSEGLADPEKIGIIGFSRTCFYVMETLTVSSLHFKAASITDGQMIMYLQYMQMVGFRNNDIGQQFDAVMGAQPFGAGLQEWLKRSPGFNLDKVNAPLLVVGEGPSSVLLMWEPYAGLRYLGKPVDLVMLNTAEHVLTNPAIRMASQGGSVDWFRFWLQDYEDPAPAKAEQYARWRDLRKVQEANQHHPSPPHSISD